MLRILYFLKIFGQRCSSPQGQGLLQSVDQSRTNLKPFYKRAHNQWDAEILKVFLIWRFSVDLCTTVYFTAVPFVNKNMVNDFQTVFRPGQSKIGLNIDTWVLHS